MFKKHAVASHEENASQAGRDVLKRGGNAIDAAVATAFALAVTHPAAGNLGGGGFFVAYLADRHEVVTIDFREEAPQAAEPRMYLGTDGKLLPHHRAGARAAGVPGTVRGLALAHSLYGKTPWPELVQPAVRLAREGFRMSAPLARSLNQQFAGGRRESSKHRSNGDRLRDFPESVAVFGKPDGSPWHDGDLLVQADLAATLERIARNGPDEFYTGKTAELIADYMRAHGGLITRDDLARYRPKPRPYVHTTYRGFDIYGMGPSSSGGVVLCALLNLLERYDLKADGPRSARTLGRVTEAMRRAYFVRATAIADPDFVRVPVGTLISKPYADELAQSIGERATPSARLADFPIIGAEGTETTHLSTIDEHGTAVALTYTLEESFGSKAVVAGAGFLLNNEMGDFNLVPDRTDTSGQIGTPANLIAPGKRMLSSQTPTIVLSGGRVHIVTGSPGGRTIPNTVLWVLLNLLDFGLEPRAAVDAHRTHHQWFPDVLKLEGSSWSDELRKSLVARGYTLDTADVQGEAHTIVVDLQTGMRQAVADRRRGTGAAAGD